MAVAADRGEESSADIEREWMREIGRKSDRQKIKFGAGGLEEYLHIL